MCVLSIKVPIRKSLETYLMILVYASEYVFRYVYIPMYVCIWVSVGMLIHTCLCLCICIGMYIYIYLSVYLYRHVYIDICLCVYAFMCVCVCIDKISYVSKILSVSLSLHFSFPILWLVYLIMLPWRAHKNTFLKIKNFFSQSLS